MLALKHTVAATKPSSLLARLFGLTLGFYLIAQPPCSAGVAFIEDTSRHGQQGREGQRGAH